MCNTVQCMTFSFSFKENCFCININVIFFVDLMLMLHGEIIIIYWLLESGDWILLTRVLWIMFCKSSWDNIIDQINAATKLSH